MLVPIVPLHENIVLIGFGPQEEGGDHGEVSEPHRQHPQGPEDQPGGVHHGNGVGN